jgi:hypothetical protein
MIDIFIVISWYNFCCALRQIQSEFNFCLDAPQMFNSSSSPKFCSYEVGTELN